MTIFRRKRLKKKVHPNKENLALMQYKEITSFRLGSYISPWSKESHKQKTHNIGIGVKIYMNQS